jgi:hypothetical protein
MTPVAPGRISAGPRCFQSGSKSANRIGRTLRKRTGHVRPLPNVNRWRSFIARKADFFSERSIVCGGYLTVTKRGNDDETDNNRTGNSFRALKYIRICTKRIFGRFRWRKLHRWRLDSKRHDQRLFNEPNDDGQLWHGRRRHKPE